MKKYLIANIIIGFSYRFDEYFKDNIETYLYEGNQDAAHNIVVKYKKDLEAPKEGNYRIFSKSLKGVKSLMTYDKDYKNIEVWIDDEAFTDLATAEYIYTGMIFLELAQRHGLLPLHGSAITYDDEVILFSAPSGTGKTTHAKMWHRLYPEHVLWLNDDKPLLSIEDNKVYVYGAPFSGKHKANTNRKIPLKSIVFLRQGVTDKVTKLKKDEALKHLMVNSLRPTEEKLWDNTLKQFDYILNNIPIYHLDASVSLNAAEAVKEAIYGK